MDVSAVLFVNDVEKVADFYAQALGLTCTAKDADHAALDCAGFALIVHQIPKGGASTTTIAQPPKRRVEAAIRLHFPVRSVEETRALAKLSGGKVDDVPPPWADPAAKVFLGHDPEGNVFSVSPASR